MMYEISTSLLLLSKMYLIMSKHRKSLVVLKKLVFISNFNGGAENDGQENDGQGHCRGWKMQDWN